MLVFSELQCAVRHPVSDQGDRWSQPGGGRDGSQVSHGGARGLDKSYDEGK